MSFWIAIIILNTIAIIAILVANRELDKALRAIESVSSSLAERSSSRRFSSSLALRRSLGSAQHPGVVSRAIFSSSTDGIFDGKKGSSSGMAGFYGNVGGGMSNFVLDTCSGA